MRNFVKGVFDAYQVEYLSLLHEGVKAIHHFFNGSFPVPPVNVEDVDVRSP